MHLLSHHQRLVEFTRASRLGETSRSQEGGLLDHGSVDDSGDALGLCRGLSHQTNAGVSTRAKRLLVARRKDDRRLQVAAFDATNRLILVTDFDDFDAVDGLETLEQLDGQGIFLQRD